MGDGGLGCCMSWGAADRRASSGSRPRILRQRAGSERAHTSSRSTGQSVCVDWLTRRAGGFQQSASGGCEELRARTPLLPPRPGVGRFGLLWGELARICNAWIALRTCGQTAGFGLWLPLRGVARRSARRIILNGRVIHGGRIFK